MESTLDALSKELAELILSETEYGVNFQSGWEGSANKEGQQQLTGSLMTTHVRKDRLQHVQAKQAAEQRNDN